MTELLEARAAAGGGAVPGLGSPTDVGEDGGGDGDGAPNSAGKRSVDRRVVLDDIDWTVVSQVCPMEPAPAAQ